MEEKSNKEVPLRARPWLLLLLLLTICTTRARSLSPLPQTSSNLRLSFSASRINAREPSIPLPDFGSETGCPCTPPHGAPKLRISMSPRISLSIACAPLPLYFQFRRSSRCPFLRTSGRSAESMITACNPSFTSSFVPAAAF